MPKIDYNFCRVKDMIKWTAETDSTVNFDPETVEKASSTWGSGDTPCSNPFGIVQCQP